MPAPVLLALPFLLAAVAALLLAGAPARPGIIGVVLVALATTAASRVPHGTPSFQLINGALLTGGLLLFVVGIAMARRKGRPEAVVSPVSPGMVPGGAAPSRIPAILRRWGMPGLLGLLLVPSLWFVFTVAGPDAWSLQGLRDAPFSPAGETLLASLLLPATLVLAGVWPFGAIAGGPRFAPLGALLLIAVVVPMIADGLEHWRSLYAAWLVLAGLVAAMSANWPGITAGAGLFAIACGSEAVYWAGASLTIIASMLTLAASMRVTVARLAYFAAGACGIVALRATLANEVVYSVLMLLPVVVGVLRTDRAARTA